MATSHAVFGRAPACRFPQRLPATESILSIPLAIDISTPAVARGKLFGHTPRRVIDRVCGTAKNWHLLIPGFSLQNLQSNLLMYSLTKHRLDLSTCISFPEVVRSRSSTKTRASVLRRDRATRSNSCDWLPLELPWQHSWGLGSGGNQWRRRQFEPLLQHT